MLPSAPVIIVPEAPGPDTVPAQVVRVFDGDGFMARVTRPFPSGGPTTTVDIPVRLGFIDAPESDQPGGLEARAFLAHLIGGTTLDLAILLKSDTGSILDRHGRVVCVPYLAHHYPTIECWSADGARHRIHRFGAPQRIHRNIELEMIVNGWAWVLERYGPDERYLVALEDARRHRRGIWASDGNIPPWEAKRRKYHSMRTASGHARIGGAAGNPAPPPGPPDLFGATPR